MDNFANAGVVKKLNRVRDSYMDIDKEGHTLIYTEYVTGVVNQILKAVRDAGYSCGLCIGENKSGLQPFKDGKLDVLVASHPAAVAVDGL
jgi:reverse gyrase